MYWLRKFYGPTIFFAPETEEGADPETPEEGDEGEGTEEAEEGDEEEDPDESEETEEEDSDESEESTGAASASRRESRNARQARENRELREKLARTEGELNATRKPAADPAEARRTREEKLALMSPEERQIFEANEKIHGLQNESRNTQFMVLDMADKNSYELMATRDPIAAKYKPEVEKLLAEMRKNGTNAPRETLLDYIIGKHARMAAQSKTGKKNIAKRKEEAGARVNQSKSKPMSARADGAGGKGGETA
jgi:hypothetical protein